MNDAAESPWGLGHVPALDGLRAAAVAAVLLHHLNVSWFDVGSYGVDVFFTLSGFLITGLLVGEIDRTGRIALRRFWVRRALRLVPALVVVVAFVAVFADVMQSGSRRAIVPTLLYYTNWYQAAGGDAGALSHTWSLAIEEQFYLVWPPLLIALWRVDRSLTVALRVIGGGIIAIAIVRYLVIDGGAETHRWYNDFGLRSDALLVGCWLAIYLRRNGVPRWLPGSRIGTLAMVVLAGILVRGEVAPQAWGPAGSSIERTVVAVSTAAIIAQVIAGDRGQLSRSLAHPAMRWVGVRSYAIYLWHIPLLRNDLVLERSGDVMWGVGLTIAAAAISYRYVEQPFLAMRDRLAIARAPHVAAVA